MILLLLLLGGLAAAKAAKSTAVPAIAAGPTVSPFPAGHGEFHHVAQEFSSVVNETALTDASANLSNAFQLYQHIESSQKRQASYSTNIATGGPGSGPGGAGNPGGGGGAGGGHPTK